MPAARNALATPMPRPPARPGRTVAWVPALWALSALGGAGSPPDRRPGEPGNGPREAGGGDLYPVAPSDPEAPTGATWEEFAPLPERDRRRVFALFLSRQFAILDLPTRDVDDEFGGQAEIARAFGVLFDHDRIMKLSRPFG